MTERIYLIDSTNTHHLFRSKCDFILFKKLPSNVTHNLVLIYFNNGARLLFDSSWD